MLNLLTEIFQKSTIFGIFETSNLICSYIIKNCRVSDDNIKIVMLSDFLKIYLLYLNSENYSKYFSQKCLKNFLKICYIVSENYQTAYYEYVFSNNFFQDISKLIEKSIKLPSNLITEESTNKYLCYMIEYLLDTNRYNTLKFIKDDYMFNWLLSIKFSDFTNYSVILRLSKKIIFYYELIKKNPFVKILSFN